MKVKIKANKQLNSSDFILIDRSGSMANKWEETLNSINHYITELANATPDSKVTVAVFDTNLGSNFDVIRKSIKANEFIPLSNADAIPRGGTPLYDSIGKIVSLAKEENSDKTVIVIMTDGEENSSVELNKENTKVLLDECKAKNWQVLFLGADFDAISQASTVGVDLSGSLNMSAGKYSSTLNSVSNLRSIYVNSGANIDLSTINTNNKII